MYSFKKGARIAGIVLGVLALVLYPIGTVGDVINVFNDYKRMGMSFNVFGNRVSCMAVVGLLNLVFWMIILIRGRKGLLSCIFMGILALLGIITNGMFHIGQPLSDITALVGILVYALLAVDSAADLKLNPGLKKALLGGGMLLHSLLMAAETVNLHLNGHAVQFFRSAMLGRVSFGRLLAIFLPVVFSVLFQIPAFAMRIIGTFSLAGTAKAPKGGAPAAQTRYQGYPPYQGQPYQAPQYQAPQYQAPQYQQPQYQQPQYQAPQYQAPQYQQPQHQDQQYQAPQYQQPQYQQPQYQDQQYQAPQYQQPQYQQPQYQQPQYQEQQYQAPQYQQPQHQDGQQYQAPQYQQPQHQDQQYQAPQYQQPQHQDGQQWQPEDQQ